MTEGSTILIDDKLLQDVRNEHDQITCNMYKYNDDKIELDDEYDDDEENYTSTDQADDDNDEEEEGERDLTNLTWLIELRNQTMDFVNMTLEEDIKKDKNKIDISVPTEQTTVQQGSQHCQEFENELDFTPLTAKLEQKSQRVHTDISQHKSKETRAIKISNQQKRQSPAERYEMFLNKIKRELEIYEESALYYQSDVVQKPPFNYSHIIGMAMLENGRRVTLQQICTWIERKFAFFRVRKKWNNSIRHNLSLHPCFRKIGRNKEDKGKGGYWELGVDPKKIDRKRIRNRKSSGQGGKAKNKKYIKTKKKRQQNMTINKKISLKHIQENLRKFPGEYDYEELLLDEMDVQQNIDVMSTNTNSHNKNTHDTSCKPSQRQRINPTNKIISPESEKMLSNYNNADDSVALEQNEGTHFTINTNEQSPSEQSCQQQYKLDTIIISSSEVGEDMPSIQNINPRTLNSFLTTNPTKKLIFDEQQQYHKCIRYSEVDDVQQNENVIISSCLCNLSDGLTTCVHESTSNQCPNINTTSPSNTVTLDFSAFPAQTVKTKPNVIVEQVIQPSLNFSAIEISSDCMPTSTLNTTTTRMCMIGSQNGNYPNGVVNENFRPYIDGIDEAFQYLRSIDNTRNEDILDNLLDITVSDY
ncbi:forkhead box protein O [Lucilia sericata]|uniref:forkhead box protein O n=1 Tax=Lucilia sericata TaxID=13632 RepID=UPI0018A8535E|nr:forkhead box protein O [Lucilia sericata]